VVAHICCSYRGPRRARFWLVGVIGQMWEERNSQVSAERHGANLGHPLATSGPGRVAHSSLLSGLSGGVLWGGKRKRALIFTV